MNKVSQRLKQLRVDSGLRQYEIAKKMNMSQGAIAHWESGRNEPSIDDLKKLASILKTDVQVLSGSPSLGLQPITYTLGDEPTLQKVENLTAPKIQLGDDIESYIITIVGSNRYSPAYNKGDMIYSRQRGMTPKSASLKDHECLIITDEGDKYIGSLRSEDKHFWTIRIASSAPISGVKIKSVHPVVWVKRHID